MLAGIGENLELHHHVDDLDRQLDGSNFPA